jgi:hypothetical protein
LATLARGKLGVEAFDRDDQSIGIFPSLTAAISALVNLGDTRR